MVGFWSQMLSHFLSRVCSLRTRPGTGTGKHVHIYRNKASILFENPHMLFITHEFYTCLLKHPKYVLIERHNGNDWKAKYEKTLRKWKNIHILLMLQTGYICLSESRQYLCIMSVSTWNDLAISNIIRLPDSTTYTKMISVFPNEKTVSRNIPRV